MQTVYVSQPSNIHDAWANLSRLLLQTKALFSFMAEATDYDDNFHQVAGLGLELTEEAERRAETLRDFVKKYTQEQTTAQRGD